MAQSSVQITLKHFKDPFFAVLGPFKNLERAENWCSHSGFREAALRRGVKVEVQPAKTGSGFFIQRAIFSKKAEALLVELLRLNLNQIARRRPQPQSPEDTAGDSEE